MANTIYLKFTNYGTSAPTIKGNVTTKGYEGAISAQSLTWNAEQTLNIGSQSSGAGAGKVTFNDLHFIKDVDATSPIFFQMLCAGIPFEFVDIGFISAGVSCRLKLAAVKSIDGTFDDTSTEDIALEYGGIIWTVGAVNGGWNRVKNIADITLATPIT